jgi:thiaminase/transcriptional activator TenA
MVATLGVSAEPDAMRVFGTMGDAKYSQELWRAGANLYSRILRHPFLLGLVRGDLPTAKFGFFLEQDMAFLDLYSRSICLLAARAPGAQAVRQFSRDAADSLGAEQDAESGWLEQLGLQASGEVEPAPTTLAYGRFLLSEVQSGSFLQGVAAVLPCYWVYHEVGRELARLGSPTPVYQRWIDNYSSQDFEAVTARVRAILDQEASTASALELESGRRSYLVALRYEWMFWDMAWRMERWPVSDGP